MKQATTTPKICAEIQAAPCSMTDQALADHYRVSARHNLLATLMPIQEKS